MNFRPDVFEVNPEQGHVACGGESVVVDLSQGAGESWTAIDVEVYGVHA